MEAAFHPARGRGVPANSTVAEVRFRTMLFTACRPSRTSTHHRARAIGEHIDHFALTFVTPLGADDDNVLTHVRSRFLVCMQYADEYGAIWLLNCASPFSREAEMRGIP